MFARMMPPWWHNKVEELGDHAWSFENIFSEGEKLPKIDIEKVSGVHFPVDSVFYFHARSLFLIGSKGSVPDTE